jgi:hypothetical protein
MLKKNCNYNKYITKHREKIIRLADDNQLPEEEKHKQMRKTIFSIIIIHRLMIQETIDLINKYSDYKRAYERAIAKHSLSPDSFSESVEELIKGREDCKESIDKLKALLIQDGKFICEGLDLWQSFGASLEDLFNLCNAKPKQIQEVYRDNFEEKKFSEIMMVYCLDYNHKGDWYDMRNYAPLTHSIKEYFFDDLQRINVKYPEIKESMGNKMQEMFPELCKHVVKEKKDENGNIYYFNGDKPIALKEIAVPLDDSLKEVIVNAIEAVVINGDKSNEERTDFVYSLLRNAGDFQTLFDYFAEGDREAIEEWLDITCPKFISSNEISKIMDACNYTKFD